MTGRRDDAPPEESTGRQGGEPRRAVVGGDDGRPPVVLLREGTPPRVRRRRWIAATLLVAVTLGGLYLGRDAVARWTGVELPGTATGSSEVAGASGPGSAAGEPGPRGRAAAGRREPEGGRPPADSARTDTSAAALLGRRLDSLAVGLDRYRERHGDFVRGRLGCEGLTRGFTAVQDRFDAASRTFGRLEERSATGAGGAAASLRERYRRLSVTVDSVNRLFAASGCAEAGE